MSVVETKKLSAAEILDVLGTSWDWKALLKMIVELVGLPKLMTTSRMKVVSVALAAEFPNMKAKVRAQVAKVAVEAFLKDLV
jgi:hypothetical protein